jgi:hypothetical protein
MICLAAQHHCAVAVAANDQRLLSGNTARLTGQAGAVDARPAPKGLAECSDRPALKAGRLVLQVLPLGVAPTSLSPGNWPGVTDIRIKVTERCPAAVVDKGYGQTKGGRGNVRASVMAHHDGNCRLHRTTLKRTWLVLRSLTWAHMRKQRLNELRTAAQGFVFTPSCHNPALQHAPPPG